MADFTKEEVLALAERIGGPYALTQGDRWEAVSIIRAYAEAMSAVPVGYRFRHETAYPDAWHIGQHVSPSMEQAGWIVEPVYAAPPVSAPAEPVAVKDLEWSNERKHGLSMRIGRGLGFAYEVCVKAYSPGWIATFGGLTVIYDGDDEDAAVAACQADYEARIRSAIVSPAAPVAEAGAVVPAGWRLVPESALAWLFGEGPAPDGTEFGEGPRSLGMFWWRTEFRKMLASASPPPAREIGEANDG